MPRPCASATSRSKSSSVPNTRIDRVVVGHVVADVEAGRRVDRRQPDRVDAERCSRAVVEVVELVDQARQVPDAVAVRVREASAGRPGRRRRAATSRRRTRRSRRALERATGRGVVGHRRRPPAKGPMRVGGRSKPTTRPVRRVPARCAPLYSAPMTEQPPTRTADRADRPARRPRARGGRPGRPPAAPRPAPDHFEIAAIADLSPCLVEPPSASATGSRRAAGSRSLDDDASGAADLDAPPDPDAPGRMATAVLAGLDRGLAVFAEKPLALDPRRGRRHRRPAGRRPAARLQVGYMKLYDPAVVAGVARRRRPGARRAAPGDRGDVLHPTSERQLAHARLLPPPTTSTRARSPPSATRPSDLYADGARRRPAARSAGSTRHPAREHRPRARADPGLRRRPDRRSTRSTSGRPTAGRRRWRSTGRLPDDARFADPLALPARLPRLPRGGPGRLRARPRSSWRSRRRTCSTPRPSCASSSSTTRRGDQAGVTPCWTSMRRGIRARSCSPSMRWSPTARRRRPGSRRAAPTSSRASGSWPAVRRSSGSPIGGEAAG